MEFNRMGVAELAAAISERRVSAYEATQACLEFLAQAGPQLNCVARCDPEIALDAARKADSELAAGHRRGPLHGVPLAHKDMYYRAGRISACGSRILADFRPETTSTALTRLDRAGALDIARLSMVEFALGTTGHNEITGTPRNPWNRDYITGGSSSGPGAAVAARLVPAALGSDTGGSIRLPAACCGLVGLKPTYGRVSRHGAMPLSFTLDCVGPLTRDVTDTALILQAIAGRDPQDPTSSARPVPDYMAALEAGVKGLRVGVPETYFYDTTEPEVARIVRRSLEVYREIGAEIVPVTLPGSLQHANPLTMLIIAVEGAAFHGRWLRERPDDYGAQTLARLLPGLFLPAPRYIDALSLRRKLLQEFTEAVFERADVLHTPMFPKALPTIAESDLAANPDFGAYIAATGHCSRPVNFMGLPAISVPAGFTEKGLPCSFQLIGPPFDEAGLLRAARAYERETDWSRQAPSL
jgi:aspartyl-tRNA(Asn)/glutamyl-tRNA(Gln) amidotransferase subunit A